MLIIPAIDLKDGQCVRLRQGAMVEARYRGRPRYYPGKIRRDHGDGTFDVEIMDQCTAGRAHPLPVQKL